MLDGISRVKKAVLISTVVPRFMQFEDNPDGVPPAVIESFRASMEKDRAQFFIDVPTGPFFGYNRPGAVVSQGQIDSWFQQGLQGGLKATYETTRSWEGDYREDLKAMDFPILAIHGDDDQIVPIKTGAYGIAKLRPDATLKIYPGGPHALPNTDPESINNDLLQFLEG